MQQVNMKILINASPTQGREGTKSPPAGELADEAYSPDRIKADIEQIENLKMKLLKLQDFSRYQI
jgi:hypothetical protein